MITDLTNGTGTFLVGSGRFARLRQIILSELFM